MLDGRCLNTAAARASWITRRAVREAMPCIEDAVEEYNHAAPLCARSVRLEASWTAIRDRGYPQDRTVCCGRQAVRWRCAAYQAGAPVLDVAGLTKHRPVLEDRTKECERVDAEKIYMKLGFPAKTSVNEGFARAAVAGLCRAARIDGPLAEIGDIKNRQCPRP